MNFVIVNANKTAFTPKTSTLQWKIDPDQLASITSHSRNPGTYPYQSPNIPGDNAAGNPTPCGYPSH